MPYFNLIPDVLKPESTRIQIGVTVRILSESLNGETRMCFSPTHIDNQGKHLGVCCPPIESTVLFTQSCALVGDTIGFGLTALPLVASVATRSSDPKTATRQVTALQDLTFGNVNSYHRVMFGVNEQGAIVMDGPQPPLAHPLMASCLQMQSEMLSSPRPGSSRRYNASWLKQVLQLAKALSLPTYIVRSPFPSQRPLKDALEMETNSRLGMTFIVKVHTPSHPMLTHCST